MEKNLTIEEIIRVARAYLIADSERMCKRPKGFNKLEWRAQNPLPDNVQRPLWKTNRYAISVGEINGQWFDAWVWRKCAGSKTVRIDLREPDAQANINKYI